VRLEQDGRRNVFVSPCTRGIGDGTVEERIVVIVVLNATRTRTSLFAGTSLAKAWIGAQEKDGCFSRLGRTVGGRPVTRQIVAEPTFAVERSFFLSIPALIGQDGTIGIVGLKEFGIATIGSIRRANVTVPDTGTTSHQGCGEAHVSSGGTVGLLRGGRGLGKVVDGRVHFLCKLAVAWLQCTMDRHTSDAFLASETGTGLEIADFWGHDLVAAGAEDKQMGMAIVCAARAGANSISDLD